MAKLLIVEDDELLNEAYRRKFESKYEVRCELDGEKGLRAVRSWNPDAIILDIFLPGKYSGLDVLKEIRSDSRFVKTPILVVTNFPDAISKVKALGATACCMKTDVDLDEVENDIESLLAKTT